MDQHLFTDSHAKSILTTMNNLRKVNKLCDVNLKVENKLFPAHRIVLAACSDYFCAMFTGNVSWQIVSKAWERGSYVIREQQSSRLGLNLRL